MRRIQHIVQVLCISWLFLTQRSRETLHLSQISQFQRSYSFNFFYHSWLGTLGFLFGFCRFSRFHLAWWGALTDARLCWAAGALSGPMTHHKRWLSPEFPCLVMCLLLFLFCHPLAEKEKTCSPRPPVHSFVCHESRMLVTNGRICIFWYAMIDGFHVNKFNRKH